MKVDPLRYVDDCASGLDQLANMQYKIGDRRDSAATRWLASRMRHAPGVVTTQIPLGDEKLTDLRGKPIEMPVPELTLSYYCGNEFLAGNLISCPHRVLYLLKPTQELCEEMQAVNIIMSDTVPAAMMVFAAYADDDYDWRPAAFGYGVCHHWDVGPPAATPIPVHEALVGRRNICDTGAAGKPVVLQMDACYAIAKQIGRERMLQEMLHDIAEEVHAAIDLLQVWHNPGLKREKRGKSTMLHMSGAGRAA